MQLPGNTTSLLATGVVGIVEFVFTIPAVMWVDQIGRKKILIVGAAGMAICHFIVAGIIGAYQGEFAEHRAAGWTAIVFVWIFVINFAYSWGRLHCRIRFNDCMTDPTRPRRVDRDIRGLSP
jgi:MFS family permease